MSKLMKLAQEPSRAQLSQQVSSKKYAKTPKTMKNLLHHTLASSLLVGSVSAATSYIGPVFDLFDDTATTNTNADNWTNGTPGAGNDGTVASNFDFSTFGASNNGNVNPLPSGTFSVTQTAGAGTGGQWNLAGNSDFTYNLNGGSITSTAGTFFINGNTFNVAGGDLTANTMRVLGNLNISSGSIAVPALDMETNSVLTQTGGTITTTSAIVLTQSNSGSKVANLAGGSYSNSSASFLFANANMAIGIGGDFVLDAGSATGLFNNTGGTSTIDFASDWTGSLTLDSVTAWDDVFEAEVGRVTVDGVNIGSGEFETYFLNNAGVITLVPEPSTALLSLIACGGLFVRRRRHS